MWIKFLCFVLGHKTRLSKWQPFNGADRWLRTLDCDRCGDRVFYQVSRGEKKPLDIWE
jgi:hypothetical protein